MIPYLARIKIHTTSWLCYPPSTTSISLSKLRTSTNLFYWVSKYEFPKISHCLIWTNLLLSMVMRSLVLDLLNAKFYHTQEQKLSSIIALALDIAK